MCMSIQENGNTNRVKYKSKNPDRENEKSKRLKFWQPRDKLE